MVGTARTAGVFVIKDDAVAFAETRVCMYVEVGMIAVDVESGCVDITVAGTDVEVAEAGIKV